MSTPQFKAEERKAIIRHVPWVAAIMIVGFHLLLNYTLPVVMYMHSVDKLFQEPDGSITGEIVGIKIKDCRLILGSEIGLIEYPDGLRRAKNFEFLNDSQYDKNQFSRPRGWQHFGAWRWTPEEGENKYNVISVRVRIAHLCGDSLVETTIGPFSLRD